jgi:hypothetical protein
MKLYETESAGERVVFEPAGKRKLKDLQRTGSALKQRKFMKNQRLGFRRFQVTLLPHLGYCLSPVIFLFPLTHDPLFKDRIIDRSGWLIYGK